MIDITGVDLKKFVRKVYELSSPQGFGFLQPHQVELSDENVEEILNFKGLRTLGTVRLDMDYVNGRACKMTVWKKEGKLEIRDSWYDHTDEQLKELLDTFGIKVGKTGEHGVACHCASCRQKRQEKKNGQTYFRKHILEGNKEREVWLDGMQLSPKRSQKVWNHSPDGFNWGYGGSGPAQLALAIMLELTGKMDGYQDFKWKVIAGLPQGAFKIEFELPEEK